MCPSFVIKFSDIVYSRMILNKMLKIKNDFIKVIVGCGLRYDQKKKCNFYFNKLYRI